MKKFLLCTLILSLLFMPIEIYNSNAESMEYRRVITHDTPFYSDSLGRNFVFFLPYTYYVKVLEEVDGFAHVECYSNQTTTIDGYVPIDMLYNDGLQVYSPFLNLKIYTANVSVLYSDIELKNSIQYVFADREMSYYGLADPDAKIYYVEYNGRLGYVKEAEILPFTIDDHPNELTFLQPEPEPVPEQQPSGTETNNSSDYFSLKVIVIVCLIFAGLIGLFIAFKPRKTYDNSVGYYDENDFE